MLTVQIIENKQEFFRMRVCVGKGKSETSKLQDKKAKRNKKPKKKKKL